MATASTSRPTKGSTSHNPCAANATPKANETATSDANTIASCRGLAEQFLLISQVMDSVTLAPAFASTGSAQTGRIICKAPGRSRPQAPAPTGRPRTDAAGDLLGRDAQV